MASKDKKKSPAFLFYTSDFISMTSFLNYEEMGKFIKLCCLQHQHGHLSEEQMLYICGIYIPPIYDLFEKDKDGKYYNNMVENEGIKRDKYVESRRENRSKKTYDEHMENENEYENEYVNEYIKDNNYTNELKEIIMSWLSYKRERKEKYQKQGFKSLLTQIKNNVNRYGEEKVIDVINSSMASNYKGIIWDKLKEQKNQVTVARKSNYEKGQEILQRIREEYEQERSN